MKALYIDQVSANPESLQKKGHQTIKGADILEWNLLSAPLEYGTYDAYFARGLTEGKKQALLHGGLPQDSIERLVPAAPGGTLPFEDSDHGVVMTAGRSSS